MYRYPLIATSWPEEVQRGLRWHLWCQHGKGNSGDLDGWSVISWGQLVTLIRWSKHLSWWFFLHYWCETHIGSGAPAPLKLLETKWGWWQGSPRERALLERRDDSGNNWNFVANRCLEPFIMEVTGESTATGSAGQGQSFLPWHLIPAFKPGTSDLTEYSRKIEFLAQIWPAEHLPALAPRAALLCEGSAFQKVIRLDPSKLKTTDTSGVKLLVKTLGGVWGKTTLENKYEAFERIIYGTSQKNDETNESFLARHEVLFEDILNQGATIADMRAYILLRNSALTSEDKKKVIVESGGTLQYDRVVSAIRMLGSKFFQDVHGNKSVSRSKTYDVNFQDVDDEVFVSEEVYYDGWDGNEGMENTLDIFLSEGDEDASVVSQFEDVLLETIQNNEELASYMNTYVEARKRLVEKSKNRGFWISTPKGKGKGKSKQKGKGRRPLAQRIAESSCRRCGQRGHWKAECPYRDKPVPSSQTPGSGQQVANTLIPENDQEVDEDIIFEENLTLSSEGTPSWSYPEAHVVHQVRETGKRDKGNCVYVNGVHRHNLQSFLGRLCNHSYSGDHHDKKNPSLTRTEIPPQREGCLTPSAKSDKTSDGNHRMVGSGCESDNLSKIHIPKVLEESSPQHHIEQQSYFASYRTFGIVDLGASQTVMGQHQVHEFLESLPAHAKTRVYEGPTNMTFRFGNNGTVACTKAIFVPISKIWMKIAVVPSQTPFLISNSVFRNLDALVDTGKQQIEFRKLGCTVPVTLSERKLFLLDISDLIKKAEDPSALSQVGSKPSHEIVLQSQVEENCESKVSSNLVPQPHSEELYQRKPSSCESPCEEIQTLPSSSRPKSLSTSDQSCLRETSLTAHHGCGRLSTGQSLREDAPGDQSGDQPGEAESDALQRTPRAHHQVWRCKAWTTIPSSGSGRSSILPVVPEDLRQVDKADPPGICLLPPVLHRENGSYGGQPKWKEGLQKQGIWEECVSSKEEPKAVIHSDEEDWDQIEGIPQDPETHFRINQLEHMMQQMMIQVQSLTQAVQHGMKPSEQWVNIVVNFWPCVMKKTRGISFVRGITIVIAENANITIRTTG